jgi:tripartite-type tricarboxylate transporter receptor subunit TctC
MKLPRRQFLHLAAGAAALPALSRFAWAQVYPTRPVQIIVGFFAGSAADVPARLFGQWLSERLGQPFIIENRPGASGNLATQLVARASPDGYTLLLVTSIDAWNTTIYDNLSFNFIKDIAPVASIYRSFGVLVVNP